MPLALFLPLFSLAIYLIPIYLLRRKAAVVPVVFVLVLATSVVALACSLAATAAGRAPGASLSGPGSLAPPLALRIHSTTDSGYITTAGETRISSGTFIFKSTATSRPNVTQLLRKACHGAG